MPEPSLNLRNILRDEKKAKLSIVDKDFYETARKHIRELEAELDRSEPSGVKYQIIEDDLFDANDCFGMIIERRMAKLIKEASLRTSIKNRQEPENMTPEDRELYAVLYKTMSAWRGDRLNPTAQVKVNVPFVQPMPEPVKKRNIENYTVVRVLRALPTFVGMDGRNYTLAKEDVVTVPVVNANALISRGAAVQINIEVKK